MHHPTLSNAGPLNRSSPPHAKIALFRSLFRGREDVYARRFESRRTGRAGYAPACAHEWLAGVCEKPRVKCADCAHRRFLPLTDQVIRGHLSGRDARGTDLVVGVYPMLRDERCWFLAIDFDKAQWQDDVRSVWQTCQELQVPVAIERSRSGNGAHLWMFFAELVPASLARSLASYLLTETMERRPEIGLDSYDRFFPNQDTLPAGGFGNLIALPLQAGPRRIGHSVFVDLQMDPYPDQWAFLSSVPRIAREAAEAWVDRADRRGRIVAVRVPPRDDEADAPWTLPSLPHAHAPCEPPDLPNQVVVTLSDQIYVNRDGLSATVCNQLLRLAAFQNPQFYQAQARRLSTYDKPRIIACATQMSQCLVLPRGCLDDILRSLQDLKICVQVRDERHPGEPFDAVFQGQMRPEQHTAARSLLLHDTGILAATTAFGKTVVAAWLIAQRRVNTLVLVHRRQLMEQWVERLAMFLNVDRAEIGRLGGGKKRRTGRLDVAVFQSLVKGGVVDDLVSAYGQVVVDECHHVSAPSFESVMRRVKAKYVVGLSATLTRQDGQHPIVLMQCGPVRYRVDAKSSAAERPFSHTVHVRPTSFRPVAPADADQRLQFQGLCQELITDPRRNEMICDDVMQSVETGRSPLVLTQRKEHLRVLARMLEGRVPHVIVLQGGKGAGAGRLAAERLEAVPPHEPRVLLATGPYVGEGYDDPRLDTLLLAMPVSWRGTIAQYVGRLHRTCDGKTEVRVIDYADLNVRMLARMFDRRCAGYEAVGYQLLVPGNAVPGWPGEVPLPVDVRWKREYAATIRRMTRDGVDRPLARLFVHASRDMGEAGEGGERARSASEAFFWERLETMAETAGRFELNAELPIPFDGWGQMEVDFLCRDVPLVIELDGGQHLENAEAYRRDRRKDALLQEHGYLVLRFLAEDVGKRLDEVLDRVLRTLAHLGAK